MDLIQLSHCLVGRHQRDAHRVRQVGRIRESVCAGCGRAMTRDEHGWRLAGKAPAARGDGRNLT